MKLRPSLLIDPADRLRIERAVLAAEQHTAGELVVVVVRACGSYRDAGWRAAALLALLALLGLGLFAPALPLAAYLGAQAGAVALAHLALSVSALRRLFVPEAELARNASRRAWGAFAEHGLRHTEARTGILIFVALFEHRVIVLGDEGVHRALGPGESWQDVVDRVLLGLRQGRLVDGLLDAVSRCGEILRRPLPAAALNRDEIPRAIVLED